ncbi:MAG: rane protein [Segetibacter sp.]|nr:rane protein [Segetibacter sp.]
MNENDKDVGMARIVERNIDALLQRRKAEERRKTFEEKIADTVTRFTGSMLFVYIHLILFGVWIIWNLNWIGLKPFDESFVVLAMIASVEAIFLSTFVLISQNRMNLQADKRAELDLQISLLTEHEVTRIVSIVSAMAKMMKIEHSFDAEIAELSKDVEPEKVLDTMERFTKDSQDV